MWDIEKGRLSKVFTEYSGDGIHAVSTSAIADEKLKILDQNYALRGGGAEIGRLDILGPKHETSREEEKRKEERAFDYFLQRLQEARHRLISEMDELQKQIDALTKRIEERARNIEAINDDLKYFGEHGKFRLREDGYPVNAFTTDLIKAWEKKSGEKWDADTPNATTILQTIRQAEVEDQANAIEERGQKQEQWSKKWENLNDLDHELERGVSTGRFDEELVNKRTAFLDEVEAVSEKIEDPAARIDLSLLKMNL